QGYEVSVYKNGKWTKFTTKKLNLTVKNLTKGKTYKVRIRAFVKQGKQTKYSKYSTTKKVKL
ncbi:MAG: fibronectin type III domain-containing protein, partial [Clostridia bacterium]|nr:fibronectin type III domain-containing protein [Clostridia bacterium]